MTEYLYEELTGSIVASYYAVFDRLRKRAGYSELNLGEALAIELRGRGLRVATQVAVQRRYQGRSIGADMLDLLVNDLIPVEIKKVKSPDRQARGAVVHQPPAR